MAQTKPDLRWKVSWKDKTFEFNPQTELTGRRLRQMKRWYGPDYGRYNNVVVLLAQGDVDAWASVIWFCLDSAGLPKPATPDMLDFPVGDLMNEALPDAPDEPEEWDGEDQADPTPATPTETTHDWDGTSTESGPSTSSPSH